MSKWLMNMVNEESAVVRRSPQFAAKTAGRGTGEGRESPRGAVRAGSFWWGSLAALLTACAAPAEPDDWGDGDRVTLADAQVGPLPCPELPDQPPPALKRAPGGTYCSPGVVWLFGEGQAYRTEGGVEQRGWVVRDDHVLAVAWMVACDGGELRADAPVCDDVETWSLVTTDDSITVGGVTAVAEWAGGCGQ